MQQPMLFKPSLFDVTLELYQTISLSLDITNNTFVKQ